MTKIANSAVSFENQQKLRRILQNGAKVLKNHGNLEWCKRGASSTVDDEKEKEHYQRRPEDLGPDSGKSRRGQIGRKISHGL